MSAEQAAFPLDFRSSAERYAEEFKASLRERATSTGLRSARVGDPDGHDLATRTILQLLEERPRITADDVQARSPIRSNAIGSAFSQLSRAGRIRVVGYTTSSRPETHGRVQRVWEASRE